MTKTDIERLATLETKVDDMCKDISELKVTMDRFIESADKKYASKDEVAALKKLIWFIIGASTGFLVWALQSYIQHIGG
jgi:hypothetical protein